MDTQAAVEEVELKAVELERQRVQLQHQLARCQEEVECRHSSCNHFGCNCKYDFTDSAFQFSPLLPPQMLVQLNMEESADDRRHSLHRSQLEREAREEREGERGRLVAAQASLATTQVRQSCRETLREVERRRREAEEGDRQNLAQVDQCFVILRLEFYC